MKSGVWSLSKIVRLPKTKKQWAKSPPKISELINVKEKTGDIYSSVFVFCCCFLSCCFFTIFYTAFIYRQMTLYLVCRYLAWSFSYGWSKRLVRPKLIYAHLIIQPIFID
jgi:hypothetical protein